jgi:hypothetical protein
MSQNHEDKLNAMLRSRRTEAASPDLAARIILRAQGLPQVQSYSLWQSLRQLFADLHLPKPVYVLTAALVLGMFLGFSTAPQTASPPDSYATNNDSFLVDAEGWL